MENMTFKVPTEEVNITLELGDQTLKLSVIDCYDITSYASDKGAMNKRISEVTQWFNATYTTNLPESSVALIMIRCAAVIEELTKN